MQNSYWSEIVINSYQEGVSKLSERMMFSQELWYKTVCEDFSLTEKYVYSIVLLESEILNGGIDQYFNNPFGQFVYFALEGLMAIGADNRNKIINESVRLINPRNLDPSDFAKAIYFKSFKDLTNSEPSLMKELLEHTRAYYLLQDSNNENINALLENFISRAK